MKPKARKKKKRKYTYTYFVHTFSYGIPSETKKKIKTKLKNIGVHCAVNFHTFFIFLPHGMGHMGIVFGRKAAGKKWKTRTMKCEVTLNSGADSLLFP